MKVKYAILGLIIFSLLILLSIPLMESSAQSDDEAPDFLITLALMAVADERMDGVLDIADLANLRDLVDVYYANKRGYDMTIELSETLNQQRTSILKALDKKIYDRYNPRRARSTLFFSLVPGDNVYVRDPNDPKILNVDETALHKRIMNILSGGFEPEQAIIDMLNQRLKQDTPGNLEKGLDGYVAATVDGGDQLVSQDKDTTYDFSAGLSKEAYLEQLGQTKPLVFINNGARDVTVSVEYYAPPEGVAISAPGLNLTVPGENKVTATGFPQGNYTFCAHWQTDLDTDGDGIKDYDRMVTHIWLSSAHPDDPNFAETVYVNSVGTATPIGRCDGFLGEAPQTEKLMAEIFMTESDPLVVAEDPDAGDGTATGADFWDQGDEPDSEDESDPEQETQPEDEVVPTEENVPTEDPSPGEGGLSLTSEEQLNQGSHQYAISCNDPEMQSLMSTNYSWTFTADGVVGAAGVEGGSFTRVGPNTYQNNYPSTIIFTSSGFIYQTSFSETSSEGVTTTTEINCTATIQ